MPSATGRPGFPDNGRPHLKGPAERGHVKKRQKASKIFLTFLDFFSRRARSVKNRQKVSKILSDTFRAAPVLRPVLVGSEERN